MHTACFNRDMNEKQARIGLFYYIILVCWSYWYISLISNNLKRDRYVRFMRGLQTRRKNTPSAQTGSLMIELIDQSKSNP